tara:strand:+ start:314 stop:694 length:381 start_codon:yes stop_codon:yes gene_type:complete
MADDFNFDEEYANSFDFGFNTVDEAEVTDFETQVKARVADTVTNVDTTQLETKIDALIQLRQGDETQVSIAQKQHKEDLIKVEKLIMPLLYNLMKNPDDVYIKWPNRKDVIQKQINKIVGVTRRSI